MPTLTLGGYDYTIQYRKGVEQCHADALSRLPLPQKPSSVPVPGETVLLMEHLSFTPISAAQFKVWTEQDPILSKIKQQLLAGSSIDAVWFLCTAKNINTLERVQYRAARWASGSRWNPSSYCWSKSSDDCLQELKWPCIHQRHIYFSICQLHEILHYGNFTNYFQLSNASTLSLFDLFHHLSTVLEYYCT